MANKVKVRFAPSPTGDLHVGNIRTALFDWAYARHTGGTFLFRIEDTDTTRVTDEYINAAIDTLKWLGLDWDEGPEVGGENGPYLQSQRLDIYASWAQKFLDQKDAYHCYCSDVTFDHNFVPDFVLVRADGSPLYTLAVAVDDILMKVTHVLRGEDLLSSTPRQIRVYQAMGVKPEDYPVFAHLPFVMGQDNAKLSKRNGEVSIAWYREMGFLPEAICN
ncbi:MAG: glutamate--tRNA ligase, partial [Actinobacteria bacterium]|nr:glutamate--tRNA ligase [Actinomycetota bacterium]